MSKENSEKKKALEAALGQIEKQFGKGSVMKLGEYQDMNIEAIPTGALNLDIALGIGGIPRGRIIEIFNFLLSFPIIFIFSPTFIFAFCIFYNIFF